MARGKNAVALGHPMTTPPPSETGPSAEERTGLDLAATAEEIAAIFVTSGLPRTAAALPELAGKTLGCWCAPRPCHGDVLVRLAGVRAGSGVEGTK